MSKAHRMIVIICTILIIFSSLSACEKSKELVYDDSAMQIAKTFLSGTRWNDKYIDSLNDFSLSADLIYNTINQFDTNCGEIDAHKSSKSNREKFYVYFVKIVKDSGLLDMGYHDPNFIETFEQMFGHLPDCDKDGIPDIISRDDDADGKDDAVDDDDDNDGCMDWDEKDGNLGGRGNEYGETDSGQGRGASGFGRGTKPGKPGEWVETGITDPANPANGGDTSKYDDGE